MIPTPEQFQNTVDTKAAIMDNRLKEIASAYVEEIFKDSAKGVLHNIQFSVSCVEHLVAALKSHGWLRDTHYRLEGDPDHSKAQIVFRVPQSRENQ